MADWTELPKAVCLVQLKVVVTVAGTVSSAVAMTAERWEILKAEKLGWIVVEYLVAEWGLMKADMKALERAVAMVGHWVAVRVAMTVLQTAEMSVAC